MADPTIYITKNGGGKYVVQSIYDCEEQIATICLLGELAGGLASLRQDGGLSIGEAFEGLVE